MKILVINGPNLNMLGRREVSVYGDMTLSGIEDMISRRASELNVEVAFFQSNHEGSIVDRVQAAADESVDAILINPAAYTHTSVAIRDALLAVSLPFVEIHISDVKSREDFRQVNFYSDIAYKTFAGHGPEGYLMGLEALVQR